jgi:Flp pilus assembly pilin Flp
MWFSFSSFFIEFRKTKSLISMKRSIHKDYKELISCAIGLILTLFIFLLAGLISGDMKTTRLILAVFGTVGFSSLGMVTIGTMIEHWIKKRWSNRQRLIDSDGNTSRSFYMYWPYEHPPWI